MNDITVYLNKYEVAKPLLISEINVSDMAEVQIRISSTEYNYFRENEAELILEDYKIPFTISADGASIISQANNLFRESFGHSHLRVFINEELTNELIFNISTSEAKFKSIKEMMTYLLDNNDRIIDLCLSRTKYKSKNDGEAEATFDSKISQAEKIVRLLVEKEVSLKNELRHRLELVKEDINEHNFFNVNPYDVIDNLDRLSQGYSQDYITLLGKTYSLEGIVRENHINSYDLEENKIILCSLLSIKQSLIDILNTIDKGLNKLTYDKEYKIIKPFYKVSQYSIDDLYTELTTNGIKKRIDLLLESVNEMLFFFQKEIKISVNGFHPPIISPFARRSRFYLNIYKEIVEWYSLGSPRIGIDQNLTKIKSTSKIYELFTLYKIIDALHNDGWVVTNSIQHSVFKNFIPSQVDLRKDDTALSVYYEKKVRGFDKQTKHNELVALNKNNPTSKYNYYHPDFIIVKRKLDTITYFILDAKYSSSSTLIKNSVLDQLYEKYFCNLAVYDQINRILDKGPIRSVNAIHPFGEKPLTKWPTYLPKIIPEVSSLLLSQNTSQLEELLKLIEKSI